MLNIRWALAGALLFCASSALRAASHPVLRAGGSYSIDVWTTDEGLPQNSVIAMTQTRDGYLWLGTLSGLVRFDGIRFTVFDESNTPGLNSSRIVHLFEDGQGNLWIGTQNAGVALLKDGRVTSLGIGKGIPDGRLVAACQDSTGAVWLYTANGQLWRYRKGDTNGFSLGPSFCRALIAERSGLVWVGTDWRLVAFDSTAPFQPPNLPVRKEVPVARLAFLLASQSGGHWRLANGRVQKWSANGLERDLGLYPWGGALVTAACEDRQGNLVVGTQDAGLFWFDREGKATALSTNQGLSHNWVLSLLVDREGTLWVGTDGGGLNRVKRQVFETLDVSRGMVVQSACADAQGGLWFGANSGGLVYWKEGAPQPFLVNIPIRSVFVDRDQRVWAGARGAGLFQFQNGQFQRAAAAGATAPVVQAIHQDRRGRLWLGTQSGLVRLDEREGRVFTTRDGLSSEVVTAIADDRLENLWVGTEAGGLNRLRDGQFTSFRKQADGLPSDNISSLWVDGEEVLWIGTSSGLARWHAGQWTRYTTREGLISNNLGFLLDDGQGDLWIGSNAGLMRVAKKALNDFASGTTTYIPCRAYNKADGLPTGECTSGSQPGACQTRDGKLWFPTIKALVSVNLAQLKPNTNPPPVVIESVLIEGLEQVADAIRARQPQAVTVPAGKERIEIHYTSLNLAAPDRARFKYRLEGHETAWTEAGDTRVARYSKLPPGQYRFQVTACNEDGIWNETGSALGLMVQPPFWRTWWFLSAVTVGLLGAIVSVVHYLSTQKLQRQVERLRQQEALERERSRIARDLHDQLGASLTQVSLLGELVESDKNASDEVEAHARQISRTARDTTRVLDEIVWAVNPSNDTLDGLITYVCKYAQEYLAVAGLRYRVDVPAQLPGAAIPPEVRHNVFLASKEAVTNVVRHARASAVWLRLRLGPASFTLEIQDDGCGVADLGKAEARNGLRNMRKRMEDIGGAFSIGPAPEGGTLVRLTAPIEKISA